MRLLPARALLIGVVAACSSSPPPVADSMRFVNATGESRAERTRWSVTPQGVGVVRIGMSLDSLASALGQPASALSSGGRACAYLRPAALPAGVGLLALRDTIVRVDVDSGGVLTDEGVGIGDSEVGLLVLYAGVIRVEPHGAIAHTLTVANPPEATHLLVFETDGSLVLRYRAGRRAATQVPDRCA